MHENGKNTGKGKTQVVSNRGTAAVLAVSMVVVGYAIWQLTGVDLSVWWQAALLLVASYLISAVLLLGINSFAVKAYQEYQQQKM